jgi:cobalt transporter subunit CbtB
MVNSSAASRIDRSEVKAGSRISTGVASNAIIAATIAIALGATTLFVVGFSHSDLLHAAAHDVRHAAGFPCH